MCQECCCPLIPGQALWGCSGDELAGRTVAQRAVRVNLVVVRQPGWKLAQHGLGVRDGGDANVVALQGAHERPRAAATALTGRPPATRSRARAAFGGGHALDRLAQDLVFERLLAEQAL